MKSARNLFIFFASFFHYVQSNLICLEKREKITTNKNTGKKIPIFIRSGPQLLWFRIDISVNYSEDALNMYIKFVNPLYASYFSLIQLICQNIVNHTWDEIKSNWKK